MNTSIAVGMHINRYQVNRLIDQLNIVVFDNIILLYDSTALYTVCRRITMYSVHYDIGKNQTHRFRTGLWNY